jgi:hypothetical protein
MRPQTKWLQLCFLTLFICAILPCGMCHGAQCNQGETPNDCRKRLRLSSDAKVQEAPPSDADIQEMGAYNDPHYPVIQVVIKHLEKCFSTKLKAIYRKTVGNIPYYDVISKRENRKVMEFSITYYGSGAVYDVFVKRNGSFVLDDTVDLEKGTDNAGWGIGCGGGSEE